MPLKNWKPKFIKLLATSPDIASACRAVNITRQSAYAAKEKDPAFALAWDETLEAVLDACEAELVRRGKDGVMRPVFQMGREVGQIRQYSDDLLYKYLRAHRAKYRESATNINLNVTPEQLATLSDDEFDQLYRSATRRG